PIFFVPDCANEVFGTALARAGEGFDVAPNVPVVLTDDVDAGIETLKPYYAFYAGGMGARGRNFYTDLLGRFGYEAEAAQVQELFLEGKRHAAAAAVPDSFVDEAALVGPKERIAERVEAWREAGVTTLLCSTPQVEALRALAEIVL